MFVKLLAGFLALVLAASGCLCCSGGGADSTTTSTTLFDCYARADSLGDFCRMKHAMAEGDLSLCKAVKNAQYNKLCMAAAQKDEGLCVQYFKNQDDRMICGAVVKDQPKMCEDVESEAPEACYYAYAALWSKPAFCEKMTADREGCRLIANWKP